VTNLLYNGQGTCISAIDGVLIETKLPTKKEMKHPNDYHSGHKKQIGLNVQAIGDSRLHFMSLSCCCPGKTNDWMAYLRSTMSTQIDNLPPLYYIVRDAAYVNSEHLLVPHLGTSLNQREDAYTFYSSQLRIHIKQACWMVGYLLAPISCATMSLANINSGHTISAYMNAMLADFLHIQMETQHLITVR
jgi:hypothetical protein